MESDPFAFNVEPTPIGPVPLDVTCSFTKEPSHGGFHTLHFTALAPRRITVQEAHALQNAQGYHPDGYGFGVFECGWSSTQNCYIATWTCSDYNP